MILADCVGCGRMFRVDDIDVIEEVKSEVANGMEELNFLCFVCTKEHNENMAAYDKAHPNESQNG